jgi:hypothetical protein
VHLSSAVLAEGLNSLVISNSGTRFAESAADNSYNNFQFDYIKFKALVPPSRKGAILIVR